MFRKILVTGSTGFLGHHLVPILRKTFQQSELVEVCRRDYDLLEPGAPAKMLRDILPDCVVHLAGKSGGLMTNRKRPADFFYENIVMNTHTLHESWKAGVSKFVSFIGGCSYPENASSPISEDQMWNGYPNKDSAGYSVAKKTLITQSWAYRAQHGFNAVVLIPGNMYGEWDNFNVDEAHVIPALVRKFVEARDKGAAKVVVFGTGKPTRDFVYAGDVATAVAQLIRDYDSEEPINISTGRSISIKDLVQAVGKATDFKGEVIWDTSKPDGQMDKIFDVSRLNSMGLYCRTTLEEGLRRTVEWFISARSRGIARL